MALQDLSIDFDVEALGAAPQVQRGVSLLLPFEPWIRQQQIEIARIASPTGLEGRRAEWMLRQLRELSLRNSDIDEVGNVVALRPGLNDDEPAVCLMAHLDTVFPPRTELAPTLASGLLRGPGISDNAAGLAALLALCRVLQDARLSTLRPLLIVANVGEEGEGDLKGARHLFQHSRWKDRIGWTIVVDGPGAEHATTQALGSRRIKVSLRGSGGHSWSDAGAPSAVHALIRCANFVLAGIRTQHGRSSANIGMVEGGSSINTIAAQASLKVDLRAIEPEELNAMTRDLRHAIARGVEEENAGSENGGRVNAQVQIIGERPAGELRPDARILRAVTEVDRLLGIPTRFQRSSTDANIPLALGREAIAVGGGGRGGGTHTMEEWYDPSGRELGLKRLLLLTVALAGLAAASSSAPSGD